MFIFNWKFVSKVTLLVFIEEWVGLAVVLY